MQLIAAEPDIQKPMNLTIDDRGRLWVTDTIEYPFPVKEGQKGRDTVKILSDFGPDGKARKVTTFADGLNIPIGILPLPTHDPKVTEALVFSIPHILRLTDTNGDGKADKRTVLYEKYGTRDTHGMTNAFTWGFDGWVYACHGFANTSTVKAADGSKITMNSGNVYRFDPNGTHIEYFTHGQVNPFGLAFDPLGNLYSADCHTKPIYQLLRGGYYPSFGKPHDGLGFAPAMMRHSHESTAIAGIVYYTGNHFPKEYQDTLFIGNVVTNRINHDRLQRQGASAKAIQQPDFLKSNDPWFRPVDIKLGPDGAIYVADFYNCIIGHYELPLDHPKRDRHRGRIWRIVYRDKKVTPLPSLPNLSEASVNELINTLKHANLTRRTFATNQLVVRGGDTIAKSLHSLLKEKDSTPDQLIHAGWALHRLGRLSDEELLKLTKNASSQVRVHAQRIPADKQSLNDKLYQSSIAGLKDENAFVQRASAEALGQHPTFDGLKALIKLRQQVPAQDNHLLHMVRMTLRDHLKSKAVMKQVFKHDWSEDDSKSLVDVVSGVHDSPSATLALKHLQRFAEPTPRVESLVHYIARYGPKEEMAALLKLIQKHQPKQPIVQAQLLLALLRGHQERNANVSKESFSYGDSIVRQLFENISQRQKTLKGIELASAMKLKSAQEKIIEVIQKRSMDEALRRRAMEGLLSLNSEKTPTVLASILNDGSQSITLREHTATLLGQLGQNEGFTILVKALETAPARLQRAIALSLANTPKSGITLLDKIEEGKASVRLLQDREIVTRLERQPINAKERIAKLTKGLPSIDASIRTLIQNRKQRFNSKLADLAKGKQTFEKNCAICHQLNNKGTKIGPDLDGIGNRGLERLLEDTLDPNRNVDKSFRQTVLDLNNGKVLTGLLLRKEGKVLILADGQGKEIRVPEEEIAEKRVSPLSLMPGNLEEQIPEQDYYHLMKFLLSNRSR